MASVVGYFPVVAAVASRGERRAAGAPQAALSRKHLIRISGRCTFSSSRRTRPATTHSVRRSSVLAKACVGDGDESTAAGNGAGDIVPTTTSLLTAVADAKWFNTYLHASIFVFILGFVDAGYSRDWTRIGAITIEQEQTLRELSIVLGKVHAVSAIGAGIVARKRNLDVPSAVAKTLLIGFLAFCEVCFKSAPGETEE